MRIDQRLAGTANAALLTAQDVYTADRWAVWRNASGANYTVQRLSNAGAPGNDFALQATVTTQATPGTNDIYFMHQKIEGFNVNDFGLGTANAASFTISFHVRSSVAGTYGLIATNGAKNRSYVTTYTIGTANAWEYKVITIKGDVAGVWAKDNTTGLDIIWSLGAGSGSSTAASAAWLTGISYNATGAVQFVGSVVGATFAISNTQLEKGSVATPFEVRPYAVELQMCQRYLSKSQNTNIALGGLSGDGRVYFAFGAPNITYSKGRSISFPVTMRANPSVTIYRENDGVAGFFSNGVAASILLQGTSGFNAYCVTADIEFYGHWAAIAEL
jgi:hypothetical protein